MNLTHEQLKLLIETAPSAEKADELIEETTRIKNVAEKAAFIRGMFGVKVVGKVQRLLNCGYMRWRLQNTLHQPIHIHLWLI